MASQSPFFGKREREPDGFNSRPTPLVGGGTQPTSAPQTMPLGAAPVQPAAGASSSATPAAKDAASKLTVGPNIKLKGVEITDCDTLVVEGTVEATISSRLMQIAERGEYRGAAEIDIAEIRGAFDGNLTVREKLVIHATGKVTGKIRFGKIVIEEGGQLSGEVGPVTGKDGTSKDSVSA
ncbi:MAG: polymer-forming cytoskeletal protein [Variovorax sp.]